MPAIKRLRKEEKLSLSNNIIECELKIEQCRPPKIAATTISACGGGFTILKKKNNREI
jgi:hypothetical protein